jgi:hypothetical protein
MYGTSASLPCATRSFYVRLRQCILGPWQAIFDAGSSFELKRSARALRMETHPNPRRDSGLLEPGSCTLSRCPSAQTATFGSAPSASAEQIPSRK